ncbi:MAG: S-adenosylmethionine:tRNA ribosyltransferase-isomerase, partial [Clostridia bacterium]|nr:S-adenosylmethionine:tRNA ribosyltransferase-isomerase [Clostridia bacterium]
IVTDHVMHAEYYEVTKETAEIVNLAKREGRRVIAVGTTSVRTLETVANEDGTITAGSGETQIFLYPPYRMKCVEGLVTNFHLPKSTLLMLVSCITGREELLKVYKEAVEGEYRFFSFGDACLFL